MVEFRKIKVPFVSQMIGYSISYENIFGIQQITTNRLAKEKEQWGNTTTTVFFPIIDDYGYYGSLIVIFIFVLFTQYVFVRIFRTPFKTIWDLFHLEKPPALLVVMF